MTQGPSHQEQRRIEIAVNRSRPSPKHLIIHAIRMTTDILMTWMMAHMDIMLICFLISFLSTPAM